MSLSLAKAGSMMPIAASEVAGQVDDLYSFMLIISTVACLLVIGGMAYFAYKYRRKSENDKTAYITHNHILEFIWSFIPFVIFIAVFAWGWWIYDNMRTFPKDSFEVHVVGKQWSWEFQYKSGKTSNELVIPVNKPIKLIMTSMDVLHSFYLPSMRVKQDVIPGRYTAIGFKPEVKGEFHVFCTEYCGVEHSSMITKMKILSQDEFDKWLEDDPTKGLSLEEQGQQLLTSKGCVACHTTDGTKKIGPSFLNIWDADRLFVDGSSGKANENYIRESILNPNAKIVKGYAAAMPTFQGQIKDKEITAIIEYLKTLK